MITVVKQYLNALFMYVYLIYYIERIRRDRRFMFKEALDAVTQENERTLAKLAEYERSEKWKV